MSAILTKWWFWVAIAVVIFVIWQGVTGAALTSKMWNMVKDQIVTDQTRVVQIKEEQEKWYESEIAKRDVLIAQIRKDKATLAAGKVASEAEVARLKGRVSELEDEIGKIIVGNDPDTVLKSLQRRFPSIRRR
jgi:hypothetical protein